VQWEDLYTFDAQYLLYHGDRGLGTIQIGDTKMAVAKRNRSASKTAVPVATASRSSRGRKAEAIKELIPDAPPARRYRTRSDYFGEGWNNIVIGATPGRTRQAVSQAVHEPASRKRTSTEAKPKPPVPVVPMSVSVDVKPIDNHADPVTVPSAGESLDAAVTKVANEVSFSLMNLCNHYTFAGKGGIAEIEINIKIRPSGSRLTTQNVEDLNATIN
jgi:hypothetical protein